MPRRRKRSPGSLLQGRRRGAAEVSSWAVLLLLLIVPDTVQPARNEISSTTIAREDIREIRDIDGWQLDEDSLPFAWTGAWLVLLGAAYVVMRRRNLPTVPDQPIQPLCKLKPIGALALLRSQYRQGTVDGQQVVLALDELVRQELSSVTGRNARYRTAIELRQDVMGLLEEVPGSDFEYLLSLFDQAKYSGYAPDHQKIEEAFDVTERFLLSLSTERRHAVS
jgi:hypothetical protein